MQTNPSFTPYGRHPQSPFGGAPYRLFCFPCVGGGAGLFRPWAGALDNVEVWGLMPPGRERRILESPVVSMDQLLEAMLPHLIPLLDRPFLFFGHSLGALVAFETAHALRERGLPGPRRLLVSAFRSPERPNPNRELHRLPDEEFLGELRRYGGTPEAVLAHEETMNLLLPMLRADFRLHETYRYRERPPLDCPITGLAGRADRVVSAPEMAGWRAHSRAGFELEEYNGAHFFIKDQQVQVLELIQSRVDLCLGRELLATAF